MRRYPAVLGLLCLVGNLCAMPAEISPPRLIPLAVLETRAKAGIQGKSWVDLSPPTDGAGNQLIVESDDLEPAGSNRIPNYVLAFADRPGVSASVAHLARVVFYSGSVEPETKMAMGLRVAQWNASPYVAAYLEHLLRATPRGVQIVAALHSGNMRSLTVEERQALHYADALSPDRDGVPDQDYREVRANFNDSQMVELTLSVCFFSYFTRMANGFNLPVESWVLTSSAKPPAAAYTAPAGRVAVLDDTRLALLRKDDPSFNNAEGRGQSSMGLGLPHEERIMLWAPDIPQAWWDYGKALGPSVTVPRVLLRFVSLAVSTANGCRYCTLHVLLGMRRSGIDPSKLEAMRSDDSVLSPDELAVVTFTRKLTRDPGLLGAEDYSAIDSRFGRRGVGDIVLQTSYFAFMNRFNDAMRTPSEDLAIENYQQIYGASWTPSPH